MAIAIRGSATAGEGSGGTIVVTKPTGVVNDDYMIAWGVVLGAGITISTPPSGWTNILNEDTGINGRMYAYIKKAASEPASWTWTLSGFASGTIAVEAYSGVDATTALDIATTHSALTNTTSVVIPGGTTITNDAWFVTPLIEQAGSGALWVAPSGFSKDHEFSVGGTYTSTIAIGHKVITTAAATGDSTWTLADSGNAKKGIGVFLRPSGGGVTDTTAPVVTSRTVNASQLAINYDELLSTSSAHIPAISAFTVTVDGSTRGVSGVSVSGSTVTLTLASPVAAGQTVTVSYVP